MTTNTAPSMTHEQMDRIVDAHFQAELRTDIEAIMLTVTDDIEHNLGGNPEGPLHGKPAAAVFYNMLFGDLAPDGYETVRRLYGENHMVDESIIRAKAIGRPFGFEGRGRSFTFRLLHVFEFAQGLICRESGWVDMGDVARQLA